MEGCSQTETVAQREHPRTHRSPRRPPPDRAEPDGDLDDEHHHSPAIAASSVAASAAVVEWLVGPGSSSMRCWFVGLPQGPEVCGLCVLTVHEGLEPSSLGSRPSCSQNLMTPTPDRKRSA